MTPENTASGSVAGPDRTTYTTHCDWEATDDPSASIVRAVAIAVGTEPTDLRPLYEAVDPDALDRFLTYGSGARSLYFRFESCNVTVSSDGRIAVVPLA